MKIVYYKILHDTNFAWKEKVYRVRILQDLES